MHTTLAVVIFLILFAAVHKTNANISLGACSLSCNENEHQAHDMLGVATQGAPGKHGPMGPKGRRGFKGDPGARGAPGQSCECSDREEFTAKVVALQAQIDELKETLVELPTSEETADGSSTTAFASQETPTTVAETVDEEVATTSVLCPVIYENKCFIPVIERSVNYDEGVAVCKSRGGHLANIYSQTHMDDVMKYIIENRMHGSRGRGFHLGMKYDPRAKKLTFRDGTDAPAGLKWFSGYPRTVETNAGHADHTNVMLYVNSDQSSIWKYLLNIRPSGPYYVLCEIE